VRPSPVARAPDYTHLWRRTTTLEARCACPRVLLLLLAVAVSPFPGCSCPTDTLRTGLRADIDRPVPRRERDAILRSSDTAQPGKPAAAGARRSHRHPRGRSRLRRSRSYGARAIRTPNLDRSLQRACVSRFLRERLCAHVARRLLTGRYPAHRISYVIFAAEVSPSHASDLALTRLGSKSYVAVHDSYVGACRSEITSPSTQVPASDRACRQVAPGRLLARQRFLRTARIRFLRGHPALERRIPSRLAQWPGITRNVVLPRSR